VTEDMAIDNPTWQWETPDPMVSGSSGDLAKLFRNEGVKNPGVLATDAPSATATIMAREVIQNSWDAATDLRRQLEKADETVPPFVIEFRYRSLTGAAKADLVSRLDLHGLRSHVTANNRRDLGLGESDCLDHLDDDEPLTLLEINESGASGMYGPFQGARSKLYLALISLGYTVKHEGAGGSFGYGKAGLIQASHIRSIVAYTCFRERTDDPGVTRRLLGMTYWGQHETDAAYTGFARYGEVSGNGRRPFENDDADAIAASLGLGLRSAVEPRRLGSSFLLVDPGVEPEELSRAIARNWWPALVDSSFVVKVVTPDGETIVPKPKSDRVLAPFLRGYELALTAQDNSVPQEYSKALGTTAAVRGSALPVGSIGLVADLTGWSYPNDTVMVDDDEEPVGAHRSLVALVRGPRMVVEYLEVGRHAPFMRGAFVADDAVDDLLRQSEPMAHDRWQTRVDVDGIDPAAPKVAAAVDRKIRDAVKEFRKRLKPPLPKEDEIRLPMLQDLMRKMLGGRSPAKPLPPHKDKQPLSISVDQRLEPSESNADLVVFRAKVKVALSANVDDERAPVNIGLWYRFVEDGRTGEECVVEVVAPPGFTATGKGWFTGQLGHDPVAFTVTTAPYSADWTGRFMADGRLVAGPLAAAVEEASS
jgi:hypothetical protein